MNQVDYDYLLAERDAVQRLLEQTPEDDVLERRGLVSRLDDVEQELNANAPSPRFKRANLTFKGPPVVGRYGIHADFGTKATGAFVDAVATVAASLEGPLGTSGPIPRRDQSQMLITATLVGSFGFQLEEYRPGHLPFGEETPIAEAIEVTRRLLRSTLETDDELTDAVAGLESRAVESVRRFLQVLVASEAVCALDCEGRTVEFREVGEIRHSLERLDVQNRHEQQRSLTGEFQGVLPKRRTFEFRLSESDEVVVGKVAATISDPDIINQHLHQRTAILVTETRIGMGRAKLVLSQLPDWAAPE